MKTFNSVVGIFFPFPKNAQDAQTLNLQSCLLMYCIIHVLGVTAIRKPEVEGSNPVIDHMFYVFWDTRQFVLIFY